MELGSKYLKINYDACRPYKCDSNRGLCKAVSACPHDILIQEEPGDPPMLLSAKMCVGCGDCVAKCPFDVLEVQHG